MARVIVITNLKGGVGKSTICINLCDALNHAGKKVLMIDADPQGNATQVYRAEVDGNYTMYDIYKDECSAKEAIQTTYFGDIIPNEGKVKGLEGELSSSISGFNRIKKMIKELENDYEFIIIDTPPQGGIFMMQGLTAADYLIIPTEPSTFSVSGLANFPSIYNEILENTNPNLKILGVVLNNYDARKGNAREAREKLPSAVEKMGIDFYDTIIQTDASIEKAEDSSCSLFETYKNTRATDDFISFAYETLRRIQKKEENN